MPAIDVEVFDPTKMVDYYNGKIRPMGIDIINELPEKDVCIMKLYNFENNKKVYNVNIPYVRTARRETVKINDPIYTHGHPGGSLSVMQPGKITAKKEMIQTWFLCCESGSIPSVNVFEVDAIIEPGNSGGALFNNKGQLIGVTSSGRIDTLGDPSAIQHNIAVVMDEYLDLLE